MVKIIPRQRPCHYKSEIKDIFLNLFSSDSNKDIVVKKFENEFAKYIGTKYAKSMQSGRACLFLILSALNIKKDDEILLASYNTPIIPSTIIQYGAKPVFVDVDKNTFTIDPQEINKNITKKTKAIIITHIEGQLCDMDKIIKIANKHNIGVIEDCAHSIGSTYRGKKAGSFGIASLYSFCSGKQINSLGGGMVVTNNKEIYSKIKKISDKFAHPKKSVLIKKILKHYLVSLFLRPYIFLPLVYPPLYLSYMLKKDVITDLFEDMGTGKIDLKKMIKFSALQADMASKGLNSIDNNNNNRVNNAKLINKLLRKNIARQKQIPNGKGVFLNFTILAEKRNEVLKKLLKFGIDSQAAWMISCSNLKMYEECMKKCPISEEISKKAIYIPIYAQLKRNNIEYMAKVLNDVV